ncbi:MAG: M20/M25/M40 family metallo-hydrolase [Vicinamibacterales bacterium]
MPSPTARLRRSTLSTIGVLALAVAGLGGQSGPYRVAPERLLKHLTFLASDDLAGRANGSPGLERAADYIAAQFRDARLVPGGDAGSYFQPFAVTMPPEAVGQRTMTIAGPEGETRFRLGMEFHPLFVRDPELDEEDVFEPAALVFAGYGISAPGLGYDDYGAVDVRGKAVIVFTHEPQEDDSTSVFNGTALTPYADIATKAAHAADRGARLLVVVEDPRHIVDRALAPDWPSDPQIDDLRVPVLRVDRARLAQALPKLDLRMLARRIDASLRPQSVALDTATLTFDRATAVTRFRVRNVVGVLRGSDPARAGEAIVIGAHYDHLGLGGRFSMAPTAQGAVHNGADDNASGTAAVLEMARVAATRGRRFPRTLVFAAFAAEEIGLLGSKHYVRHAALPPSRTVAMINLDMIGRSRGRVLIGGNHASLDVRSHLQRLALRPSLRLDDFAEGYDGDSSDDGPFAQAGVPTVCFFTGFHGDYHRPSDDWVNVDEKGAAEIATMALRLAGELAERR